MSSEAVQRRASYCVARPAPIERVSAPVPVRAASAHSEPQATPLARRRWRRALTTLAGRGPRREFPPPLLPDNSTTVDISTRTSAKKTVADMTSKRKRLIRSSSISEFVKQRWIWAAEKLKVKKKTTAKTATMHPTYALSAESTSQSSLSQSIQRSAGSAYIFFFGFNFYLV